MLFYSIRVETRRQIVTLFTLSGHMHVKLFNFFHALLTSSNDQGIMNIDLVDTDKF
jgi:hypothetical protein